MTVMCHHIGGCAPNKILAHIADEIHLHKLSARGKSIRSKVRYDTLGRVLKHAAVSLHPFMKYTEYNAHNY